MNQEKPQKTGEAIGLPEVTVPQMRTLHELQLLMLDGVNPDGSLKTQTIKALLKFRDAEPTRMARELGISDAVFYRVLYRARPTRYIQESIAEKIGLTPELVWGRIPSPIGQV